MENQEKSNETCDEDRSLIADYYKDRNVFITGGTGFIGKVLVEKLLRSCPDVNSIILLMRSKKGKTPEERIKAVTDLPLFDRLKKEQPQNLKKIKIVTGDVRELGLGLSNEDKAFLIRNTHVIMHVAASVRFDDPLSEAIILNTRGTRELAMLGLEMEHLLSFVHVSTTYCHTNRKVIGEELYPPPADWRESIEIAEKADKQTLNIFAKKYMGSLPNTYTFAKALGEQVVHDLCAGKIPAMVIRPSIVISTITEPFPGWIDNFNGPVGLLVASGKGILRSMYTNPNVIADYVPVDLTVKGLIGGPWLKSTMTDEERLSTAVYNLSNNNVQPVTLGEIINIGKELTLDYPLNDMLWFPDGGITQCIYYHYIRVILYHMIPAIIIDAILKLAGHKPMLVKVHRRIYTANMALRYFITNEWKFINDTAYTQDKKLNAKDKEIFGICDEEVFRDIIGYLKNAAIGARKYLLKESDESFGQAKIHARRMFMLHNIVKALWYIFYFWLLFVKIDIISILVSKYHDTYEYFTTP